ncbi:MAG: alpha/beta hydrolase [Candidatus Tectomicrobia bacterium]|uniref:Alpha/beta hydrolase n=1 Tax=Tectimicrobiota bacterium TaxID=2528274 RepID=A0A932GQ92_UNCTE|nr:alpha/beta hydrolase [Candidatus Tectomicrobia bacterium]
MPHAIASGKTYHYIIGNEGARPQPTAVFVHGAGGDHTVWLAQFDALKSAGYGAVAVDLPGHGRSGGDGESSIEAFAHGVLALVHDLQIRRPVLVGHSMGGAIAMAAALISPSTLDGLVLVGSGARLRVSQQFLDGIEQNFSEAVRNICRVAFSERATAEMIERGIANMLRTSPRVLAADFRACNEFDIRDRLGALTLPALVLCGSEDRMTFPKYSQYLHERIPGSILRWVPGAGHMVMLEEPEEVSQAVLEFFSSRAGFASS